MTTDSTARHLRLGTLALVLAALFCSPGLRADDALYDKTPNRKEERRAERNADRMVDPAPPKAAPRRDPPPVAREERRPENRRPEAREERRNDNRDNRTRFGENRDERRDWREERRDNRREVREERREDRRDWREERRDDRREWRDDRHDRRSDWRRDHRWRVWPRHGVVVNTMPWGYREIRSYNRHYYFSDGLWYEPYGSSYISIAPPVGVVISSLPAGYLSFTLGSGVYYRYADAWYRPHERGYVVVDRPEDAPAEDEDPGTDALFAYPRNGQSEERQATDRFECHEWAAGQTGYDPSLTSPAGASSESLQKRPDYLRAMAACLEGRGYTVR